MLGYFFGYSDLFLKNSVEIVVVLHHRNKIIVKNMMQTLTIQQAIEAGANVSFSTNANDLREFGMFLIRTAAAEFANKPEEKYITTADAARRLHVDRSTLYRWDADNYLKPVRIGGKRRYKLSDIAKILD